jgi:hypothetical protein
MVDDAYALAKCGTHPVSYNCDKTLGDPCVAKPGKGGTYGTLAQCHANCSFSFDCKNNQCVKAGGKGAFANLIDCQQVGHCGVASAWKTLQSFVEGMSENSAATYTLANGKDRWGQCQGFDMGLFGYDSVITVDQGRQLTLTADTGNGCGGVVLDALDQGSFFIVDGSDPSPSSASLVLQGLTLRNGLGVRVPSETGAVYVMNGTLTAKDCRFEHCTATFGGAILVDGAAVLHATNTTVFNDSGESPGGSINVRGVDGTAIISNCTFSESEGVGGGAMSSSGNATITDTIFTGCSSPAAPGGALSVSGNTTITTSTFTNCSSDAPGGAIILSGNATITDSTFTGCTCGGAPGGAVFIGDGDGTITFTNCIFADNTCLLNCDPPGRVGGAIWRPGGCTDCHYFTLMLEGCKFVVPVNATAGNNDLYTGNSANDGSTTFACPPGTKGTPVTVANGPYLTKQLPPSTEIVHCAVVSI